MSRTHNLVNTDWEIVQNFSHFCQSKRVDFWPKIQFSRIFVETSLIWMSRTNNFLKKIYTDVDLVIIVIIG